jgi:hypothetical protein
MTTAVHDIRFHAGLWDDLPGLERKHPELVRDLRALFAGRLRQLKVRVENDLGATMELDLAYMRRRGDVAAQVLLREDAIDASEFAQHFRLRESDVLRCLERLMAPPDFGFSAKGDVSDLGQLDELITFAESTFRSDMDDFATRIRVCATPTELFVQPSARRRPRGVRREF